MNNKIKAIIGMIVFVLFIAASVLIYNNLSDKYKPDNRMNFNNGKNTVTPGGPVSSGADNFPGTDDSPGSSAGNNSIKYKAPDFTVFDPAGNPVKLSDFIGKPVVLNFWASWCPSCKVEMPDFNEVYSQVKNDIHFMMVDLVDGMKETREKGQKFIDEQGYVFPVYFDNNQEAAYTYWVMSIPTTYFIDSEGYIVTGYQGAINKEILSEAIELIKEK